MSVCMTFLISVVVGYVFLEQYVKYCERVRNEVKTTVLGKKNDNS